MSHVSIEAFYPESKQAVLENFVTSNLLNSRTQSQSIDILDFLSSTLDSQPTFSFSFIPLNFIEKIEFLSDNYSL